MSLPLLHTRQEFTGRVELGRFRVVRNRITGETRWQYSPTGPAVKPVWHRITVQQLTDIGFCRCVEDALTVLARGPRDPKRPPDTRPPTRTAPPVVLPPVNPPPPGNPPPGR